MRQAAEQEKYAKEKMVPEAFETAGSRFEKY